MKKKFYSIINITGLAIGMACCVLIAPYVQNERSYDQYHTKRDHIYRVVQTFRNIQPGETLSAPTPQDYQVWGCAPVGPAPRTIIWSRVSWKTFLRIASSPSTA